MLRHRLNTTARTLEQAEKDKLYHIGQVKRLKLLVSELKQELITAQKQIEYLEQKIVTLENCL